jgi:hypothetical protein
MNWLVQKSADSGVDPHWNAPDFGARAYLSYIAGGFSLAHKVYALSFCFKKEIY